MPKYASPVRLQESLMRDAALTAVAEHRSTAQQIEYWASIGRAVAHRIDPETLASMVAGMASIHVDYTGDVDVEADLVFDSLENERESGALAGSIDALAPVRYQPARGRPGLLERRDPNGVETGRFENGEFMIVSTSSPDV